MNSEPVNGNDSPTPGNLFDEFEDAFQVINLLQYSSNLSFETVVREQ